MDASCTAGEATREMDHAAEGACRGVDGDFAGLDRGVFHVGGCVEEQGEGLTVQRGDPGEAGSQCDGVLHAHSRFGQVDGVVAGRGALAGLVEGGPAGRGQLVVERGDGEDAEVAEVGRARADEAGVAEAADVRVCEVVAREVGLRGVVGPVGGVGSELDHAVRELRGGREACVAEAGAAGADEGAHGVECLLRGEGLRREGRQRRLGALVDGVCRGAVCGVCRGAFVDCVGGGVGGRTVRIGGRSGAAVAAG